MEYMKEIERMYDDRFGMFVHFGLYSILAGEWKGQRPPEHPLGEWIQWSLRIPNAQYGALAEQFRPAPDWADRLVRAAKDAGMRYVVLTSKHHDGFCLFRTAVSSYNSVDLCGRDLVEELHQACGKYGLRMGLYYSHCLDWHEPDAGGQIGTYANTPARNNNFWDFPDRTGRHDEFDAYLKRKAFPQVTEILTRYPDLYLIWFDFPHNILPAQTKELRTLVKTLAPHCLINSRIGHGCEDYTSLGDNSIPSVPTGIPTECLVTLNDTWGYKWYDNNWKTPEYMTELLARCIAGGTTLLLNVGPMADGTLTPETAHILAEMGRWTRRNAEAVYGMRENPLRFMFDWGYLAYRENRLYAYIRDKGIRTLALSGLRGKVTDAARVSDGRAAAWTQENDTLTVTLPETDETLPVYRIACDAEIIPSERIVQCGGHLNLMPIWAGKYNAAGAEDTLVFERLYDPANGTHGLAIDRTSLLTHWTDERERVYWDAAIRAGRYRVALTAALGEYAGGAEVTLTRGDAAVRTEVPVLTESSRYNLSRTGHDNIRAVYALPEITLPEDGTWRVTVGLKDGNGKNLPLYAVDLYAAQA